MDEDINLLLDALNPDQDAPTVISKGNITAHEYTLAKVRVCTENPALITVLNLIGKGQPTTKKSKGCPPCMQTKTYPNLHARQEEN